MEEAKHRVLIVGGGFGGVSAALELAREKNRFDITLISNQPHFEYHAALYRVVTGRSPLEVCIPLSTIFARTQVKLVQDTVVSVTPTSQTVTGKEGSTYHYDSLILALGSESAYFNVPGLKEYSFGLKSITEALRLKRHLHELFTKAAAEHQQGQPWPIHLVLVGGGPSGVELAGELAVYTKKLARSHGLDPHRVIIDLFEASNRLVGALSSKASELCFRRLHRLGVNIFLETPILANKIQTVYLADIKMKTKTLIWTAGTAPHQLYAKIKGLKLAQTGRVLVDLSLQAKGVRNLYVIGDAAATTYSGLAQTACYDGRTVAANIIATSQNLPVTIYRPKKPITAIPIGPGWAMVAAKFGLITGHFGWILRRFADLRFFLSILPLNQAITAFLDGRRLSESCPVCLAASKDLPAPVEGLH